MGYTETAVVVHESDGVAQLTVAISVPNASVTIGTSVSFFLLVNASDRMSTGWCSYTLRVYCSLSTCIALLIRR